MFRNHLLEPFILVTEGISAKGKRLGIKAKVGLKKFLWRIFVSHGLISAAIPAYDPIEK